MGLMGCLAVLGALFALIVAVDSLKQLSGDGQTHGFAVVVLLVWTTAAVRLFRADLYVSTEGVRKRTLLRQRTWKWSSVQEFTIKPMAGLRLLGGYAIWIRLTDGSEIETSVHYAESLPEVRGMFMAEHEAHEILRQLQGALARSRASSQAR
ncbi:hypothetical protein LWC34_36965 [Kibdelosporangium philippinense]|uniref:PH domain-containing protein n=1 Tax=Kibdelosporangium philippinense TaxID=211113 RepID=A0ABS8ZLJ6_9PSEU|nr:hypothetical protein [Kibdelosporangium philippinense]MCE7008364.1 hypothetical protein [Kibdelosporangium philippinense]